MTLTQRPQDQDSRRQQFVERMCDLSLAGIGVSYMAYSWVVAEYGSPQITPCPFFLLTGRPCLLCGMTRAFGQLLHGNLAHAMTFHPLVIPLMLLWILFTLYALITVLRDYKDCIHTRIRSAPALRSILAS